MDAYDRMKERYLGLDFMAIQAEADRVTRRLAALCEAAYGSSIVSPAEYATLLPLVDGVRAYHNARQQKKQADVLRQGARLERNVAIAQRSPDTIESVLVSVGIDPARSIPLSDEKR